MTPSPEGWVDTNVVLRFLIGSPREQALRAARLFTEAQRGTCFLYLHPLVVAEVVYVLERKYGYDPRRTRDELTEMFDTDAFVMPDASSVRGALARRANERIDFVDAFLAERAQHDGRSVASFDRDLPRLGVPIMSTP